MKRNLVLCLALSLVAGFSSTALAQPQVVYSQFDPHVVRFDRNQPVRFEARVIGNPTSVVFEYTTVVQQTGIELEMRDDGTGGDRAAGDNVYTVALQAQLITQVLQADDVFRPFIGFLKIFQNTSVVFRGNVFAEVITDQIPRLPITNLASDAQRTTHVVNLVDPDFVTGVTSDVTRITKRFYQLVNDDYDFLNVVYITTRFQNRHHFGTKNEVQGIGLSLFNNNANYGSSGKLLGISVFPISSLFDGAETAYQHELGHQWINLMNTPPLAGGIPHWPISSLASGIMGFSLPPNGQGGEYACLLTSEPGGIRLTPRNGPAVFTDLDLYLMGLLPASQVGEHVVFTDQQLARTLPCNNQLFTGAVTRINITDIVNTFGPRVPNSINAPKNFKVGTILVSNGLLGEDEMAFYNFFSRRAEETTEVAVHTGFLKGTTKPFVVSTRGLGTLNTQINAPTLLTEAVPSRAMAIDSSTWMRGPFSTLPDHIFSADGRTRIMLFVAGVDLQPGETSAIVTAQAEDSQQQTFNLPVEHVGKLAGVNWLTQINLKLPEEVSNLDEILVSIRVRGVTSNKVLVDLK